MYSFMYLISYRNYLTFVIITNVWPPYEYFRYVVDEMTIVVVIYCRTFIHLIQDFEINLNPD